TVDTVDPVTTLDPSGPTGVVASTSATFSFSSNESGTLECSLDGAAYATCSTGQSYTGLGQGSHTFRVRAVDLAGNRDHTPQERAWTVDTVAPETTISSGPAPFTSSTTASFDFSSNEPGASFECSLDGAAFTGCSTGQSYSGLAEGPHSFKVRAVDQAG